MNKRRAAMLSLALLGSALLVGCGTDRYETVPLKRLVLKDGEGRIHSYAGVLARIDDVEGDKSFIPNPYYMSDRAPHSIGKVSVTSLPQEMLWLRDYDFDGSGYLDGPEATQAWMTRVAAEASGAAYDANALRVAIGLREDYDGDSVENLEMVVSSLPTPAPLRGLRLGLSDLAWVNGSIADNPDSRVAQASRSLRDYLTGHSDE